MLFCALWTNTKLILIITETPKKKKCTSYCSYIKCLFLACGIQKEEKKSRKKKVNKFIVTTGTKEKQISALHSAANSQSSSCSHCRTSFPELSNGNFSEASANVIAICVSPRPLCLALRRQNGRNSVSSSQTKDVTFYQPVKDRPRDGTLNRFLNTYNVNI